MKLTRQMSRFWKQAVALALAALLIIPPSMFGTRVAAGSEREQDVAASFAETRKYFDLIASKFEDKKLATELVEGLAQAEKDFASGFWCEASARLSGLRRLVRELGLNKYSVLFEDIYNRLSFLRQDLLQLAGDKCNDAERFDRAPVVEIKESNAEGLSGRVSFGEPRFSSIVVDGEHYTELEIPGLQHGVGQPGLPGVPVWHHLVALPQDARAAIEVRVDDAHVETLYLNLYPVQPQPVDRAADEKDEIQFPKDRFKEPEFTRDKEAYASRDPFPARIATIHPAGRARDLNLAQISIAAGQYTADDKKLTLFESVEFQVRFIGGNGYFLDETAKSEFESLQAHFESIVLNRDILRVNFNTKYPLRLNCGEEFLILTHPDFRAAADALAAWKNQKGIPTSVVEVNDGGGPGPDTNTEIDALIENRFNRCLLRPSYILLFGDAEFIPTFYRATSGSATTGTDYPYAIVGEDADDLAPDFALGRIPVDTLDQAQTVVDKIINYEAHPPSQSSFYENAAIASQFQCCRIGGQEGRDQRSFIETSELVRNEMLIQGYGVDRIYTETVEWGYTGDSTPRRFYNGTLLPEDLRAANGFAWDGDTNDIINAFNTGRFLILHRDHGWEDGWAHPGFTSTNVTNDLNNGELLPVVFSVNCASGLFDNETAGGDYGTLVNRVYFAERLLRKENGGAIGILGDTRNSPTWANSALTRGFYDAVWPNTVPGFSNQISRRRLGDILNHGKLYLMTQVGVAGTTEAPTQNDMRSEFYMWHVIGDPTLTMWTSKPIRDLPRIYELAAWAKVLKVKYKLEGAVITLMEEEGIFYRTLGRGRVTDGVADIPLLRQPSPRARLRISVSYPNAVSVDLTQAKS